MKSEELFALGLGLLPPWEVKTVQFEDTPDGRELHIHIDLSGVCRIGIDETSSRKGHNYITNFVDLDTRQLVFCTKGKGESTIGEFAKELETLLLTYPVLGEAYKYKEGFFDVFTYDKAEDAVEYLQKWCMAVNETSLTYMKKFVNTLKAHWSGIITNFTCPGVNKQLQVISRNDIQPITVASLMIAY